MSAKKKNVCGTARNTHRTHKESNTLTLTSNQRYRCARLFFLLFSFIIVENKCVMKKGRRLLSLSHSHPQPSVPTLTHTHTRALTHTRSVISHSTVLLSHFGNRNQFTHKAMVVHVIPWYHIQIQVSVSSIYQNQSTTKAPTTAPTNEKIISNENCENQKEKKKKRKREKRKRDADRSAESVWRKIK